MPPRRQALLALVVATAACGSPPPPRPALTDAPTHDRYMQALSEFGLDKTALGQDWLRAADRALAAPIETTLPFRESGYLAPAEPAAVGYAFELRRGRRLVIDVAFEASAPARLYVDLFEDPADDEPPRRVSGTEPGALSFVYEARRDGRYILRLQPELLRGGRYTVTERTTASLGFPVQGHSLRAAQSGFGASRDGGRRSHHGIDIFAPRGTPVVAAADGRVRVDTSNLGGNVIWLSSPGRRGRLYYAHLHDWAVQNGDEVTAGQVIGYVGNTGNARTTPPHLHFGVYDRGPADPHPYLQVDDPMPRDVTAPAELIGEWARVRGRRATLLSQPHARADADVAVAVVGGTILKVRAATGAYFRVELTGGERGFLPARDIETIGTPVSSEPLSSPAFLLEAPEAGAPVVATLGAAEVVDVLGASGDFRLVRLPDRTTGWIGRAAATGAPERSDSERPRPSSATRGPGAPSSGGC